MVNLINQYGLLGLMTLALTGCITVPTSIAQQQKPKTPELDVRIFSDTDINPDVLGTPSPLRLSFLQLSTVVEFDQMNELSTDGSPYKTVLGNSVQDEINVTIRSDETLGFKLPLKEEAKYLGVLAAYQDANVPWKISLVKQDKPWHQKGKNSNFLFIRVKATGIEQLAKAQALEKILAANLQKQGKALEQLTQQQKEKLLSQIDKALTALKPADLKKGIFIESSQLVDKASQVALPDPKRDTLPPVNLTTMTQN